MEQLINEMMQTAMNYQWAESKPLNPFGANCRPLYAGKTYNYTKRVDRLKQYEVYIIDQGKQQKFLVNDLSFFKNLLECTHSHDDSLSIRRSERCIAIFGSSDSQGNPTYFKTVKGIFMKFLMFFLTSPLERNLSYYIENPQSDRLVHCQYEHAFDNCRARFETEGSGMLTHSE